MKRIEMAPGLWSVDEPDTTLAAGTGVVLLGWSHISLPRPRAL